MSKSAIILSLRIASIMTAQFGCRGELVHTYTPANSPTLIQVVAQ